MARQDPYAVTAVRHTCAPSCFSSRVVDASNVVSATVLMRVSTSVLHFLKFFYLTTRSAIIKYIFHRLITFVKKKHENVFLFSSCPVFPAPGPYGPKIGYIWTTRAVPGFLRVCRYSGLLQSNALFITAFKQYITH